MRLVRYLFVLIVVLSTSAWAAPTQAELPGSWTQAALLTQPAASERDLRIVVGHCAPAVQGAAAQACDGLAARAGRVGCVAVQECQRTVGGDGIQHGASITRGQINVVFSNAAARPFFTLRETVPEGRMRVGKI